VTIRVEALNRHHARLVIVLPAVQIVPGEEGECFGRLLNSPGKNPPMSLPGKNPRTLRPDLNMRLVAGRNA
jgi:hypothetical protein